MTRFLPALMGLMLVVSLAFAAQAIRHEKSFGDQSRKELCLRTNETREAVTLILVTFLAAKRKEGKIGRAHV